VAKVPEQLVGRKFGRLVVVQSAGRNKWRRIQWLCLCDCGNHKVVLPYDLIHGKTRSCGCLHSETAAKNVKRLHAAMVANPKHGHARAGRVSPEYSVWVTMIDRCENPNNSVFKHYGGRGIKVCERWRHSFVAFLEDMGPRPPSVPNRKRSLYSIDRFPNNDGNYEPDNCRWATQKQQVSNRRNQ